MVFHELLLSACFSLIAFLVYLVIHYYRSYTTWSREGSRLPYIPFPRDCVFYPIQKSLTLQKFYNELAPHPIGGFYKMSRPYLLVRDPELLRRILIKDFSHFVDHGFDIDEGLDPLNAHIFNLEGERWRAIRQKLTPIFSGAKMKAMWPLMMECEKVLTGHLDRLIESGTEFEVKDVMKKFAMDVIGTCAFGLRCDAIQDPESEFRKTTETVLRESHIFFLRSLLRSMGLNLVRFLKWKRIDKSVDDFFFSLVRECTKMRAKNQHTRNDLMQHLINLQHEEQEALKKDNSQAEPLMTDSVVASHAFVFFVGGFETTSGTLSFVFYNLALHPEVMEKCRAEVREVLQRHGGTMTYDSLKDMTYIQCVIDETLRVYPNVGWLERVCQEPYELPDGSYTIKKNARLLLPIYAFHMDPKYFPNPERFDPDRFSDENKNKIVPGTYFPFGDGPRSCIALRFARMEMKAAIASLIMRYDIEPSQKTDVPVQFAPTSMLISASNGIWLKWKKRNV